MYKVCRKIINDLWIQKNDINEQNNRVAIHRKIDKHFFNTLSIIYHLFVRTCDDIDECMLNKPCHYKAKCTNTPGSYSCKCDEGYLGDGIKTCERQFPEYIA